MKTVINLTKTNEDIKQFVSTQLCNVYPTCEGCPVDNYKTKCNKVDGCVEIAKEMIEKGALIITK